MLEPALCPGCVWYDPKNDSCDINGRCVRYIDRPLPDDFATDNYELFAPDEQTRLRRQLEYYRRMEE